MEFVIRCVPNDIFRVIISISGLPHAANVDDVPVIIFQSNGTFIKRSIAQILSVKRYHSQFMGVPDEADSLFHLTEGAIKGVFSNLKKIDDGRVGWETMDETAPVRNHRVILGSDVLN